MTLAHDLSLARLLTEAAWLRQRNAGAGFAPGAGPGQLYLRDPAAAARLSEQTLRPKAPYARAQAAVDAALVAARTTLEQTPCAQLAHRANLGALTTEALRVALAIALDPDTREFWLELAPRRRADAVDLGRLADVVAPTRPVTELWQALDAALNAGAPRLWSLEGVGVDATLTLAPAVVAHLAGISRSATVGAGLAPVVPWPSLQRTRLDLSLTMQLDGLAAMLRGTPMVVTVMGPRGTGRRAIAAALLARAQTPALWIDGTRLAATAQRHPRDLDDVALTAWLTHAIVVVTDIEAAIDGDASEPVRRWLRNLPGGLVTCGTRLTNLDIDRPHHAVRVPRPDLRERTNAWQDAVGDVPMAGELAARYTLGAGAIAEVALEAEAAASLHQRKLTGDDFEQAVNRRLVLHLGTFGAVVGRKAKFSEMVLPDDVADSMRTMIAMVRERSRILESWGLARHLGISRGVSAMFSGEPGTGKTMAASVIASELGLDLVRIDLSTVVSKYVGETEKNLGAIFDQAQDAHAMLLFDEADSLFGKRTELKSAQDRFANLEVNYILQRMETFDGISVLTTNSENAIDPAMQRRLNFRVRFPAPEIAEREALWRTLLPPSAITGEPPDFHTLAARFQMTGGYIKNAIVRAAVLAARAGRTIRGSDLWEAALHEYAEMGKVMPSTVGPASG